jgi:hypothetical protein
MAINTISSHNFRVRANSNRMSYLNLNMDIKGEFLKYLESKTISQIEKLKLEIKKISFNIAGGEGNYRSDIFKDFIEQSVYADKVLIIPLEQYLVYIDHYLRKSKVYV